MIKYFKNGSENNNEYFTTRQDLKTFLASNDCKHKNIILKFSAGWCGPCKKLNKNIYDCIQNITNKTTTNEITKIIMDKVHSRKEIIIIDVDVDVYDNVASYLKISSLPTIMSFYNGERMNVLSSSSYSDLVTFLCNLE